MKNLSQAQVLSSAPAASHRYLIAFLAILIVPLTGLSTDIFVPSMPDIQSFFQTNQGTVQLTITAYMLGAGVMQLFAGAISDSFGRKRPFVVSAIAYLLASIAIPLAPTIHILIGLRILQGAAVAAMVVPMRAVLSDLFEGKEFQKVTTYMAFVWTIGPIIAPFLGGYLTHYFGWESNFYFLAIYTAIVLAFILLNVPETSRYFNEFKLKAIIGKYRTILTDRHFISAGLTNGLTYALVMIVTSVTPFLLKTQLHYTPIEFGYFALALGVAWSVGSLSNRFFIHHSLSSKMNIGVTILALASIALLLGTIWLPFSIYVLAVPLIAIYLVGGLLATVNFAFALSLFPNMSASANGLFSGILFFVGSLGSGIAAQFHLVTAPALATSVVALAATIVLSQKLRAK
ncbi:MFS transporter [Vibrio sp. S4M6]|uniref:MFS transporter n=1 Tax=Vibrio sinus TaxID=2946865 RepID=UPI00202ABD60|nr:MFS transporter [Vibrio sinus]MCL9782403.1 MFS transporter [Vibrio sinus]